MTGWRQSLVGFFMLPLSLLPFVAYVTQTAEGHLLWTKAVHPLFAPDLPLLPGDEARWIDDRAPRYADAAAVLVYHGLGSSVGAEATQTMTPDQFGEQLVALRAAGMNPVTATQFADACAGGAPLPDNAVMITFDDGRTEAMLHADPLLDQADMTATMFVISGAADTPSLFYAGWSRLEEYHASGRWDLQAHTDALHDTLAPDPADEVQQRPLLVNRLDGESLTEWRRRVAVDLQASSDKLRAHTGARPVAFAYPFGAYGGDERTDDPRIARELRRLLSDHVEIAFQQDDQETVDLADCHDDPLMLRRLDVGAWTGPELLARIATMARYQQVGERIAGDSQRRPTPLAGDPRTPADQPAGDAGARGAGGDEASPSGAADGPRRSREAPAAGGLPLLGGRLPALPGDGAALPPLRPPAPTLPPVQVPAPPPPVRVPSDPAPAPSVPPPPPPRVDPTPTPTQPTPTQPAPPSPAEPEPERPAPGKKPKPERTPPGLVKKDELPGRSR